MFQRYALIPDNGQVHGYGSNGQPWASPYMSYGQMTMISDDDAQLQIETIP